MATQPGVELVPYEVSGISTAMVDGKLTEQQRNYFEDQWSECPKADVELFFWTAEKYGLNPFGVAQIYGVPRKQNQKLRLITQVGINGLTLIAQRTGEFGGIGLPEWAGADGQWRSIWNFVGTNGKPKAPDAAKISVTRFTRYGAGLSWGIAMWNESADVYDGQPRNLWRDKPALMLAKTATANAIRRAFQQEFAELRAEFAPELGEARARRRATINELYEQGGRDIEAPRARASLSEARSAGLFAEPDEEPSREPEPTPGRKPQPMTEAQAVAPEVSRQVGNQGDPSAFWALSRKLGYKGQDVAAAVFGMPTMLAWLHSDPALTWEDATRLLGETAPQERGEPEPDTDQLRETGEPPAAPEMDLGVAPQRPAAARGA